MRDYIRHEATFRDTAFAFPKLRRVIRNWFVKRQLRKLSALDDYLLNDIGLTRDDLRYGLKLPYDIDPILEISAIRDRRMAPGVRRS